MKQQYPPPGAFNQPVDAPGPSGAPAGYPAYSAAPGGPGQPPPAAVAAPYSKLFQSSFPFGSALGIPVRMHSLFPVFFFIMLLWATGYGSAYFLYVFLLFGPILLLTVFIHELGHCIATRRVGAEVHGILLWPLGGLAYVGHAGTPKDDLYVAVAGPLTHIPMFIFWIIVEVIAWKIDFGVGKVKLFGAAPAPNGHLWVSVIAGAASMQIILFAFNLLIPAYPLDGGRVLADGLLIMGFDEVKASKVTLVVSGPIAVAMVIFGFIEWQLTTIMIGFWIGMQVYNLYKHIKAGTVRMHPLFNFDNEHNKRLLQDQPVGGAAPSRPDF